MMRSHKTLNRAGLTFATLALGAGLVLGACGTTQALSATDVSNQGRGVQVGDRPAVVRDPDNAAWTGADPTRAAIDDRSGDPQLRGPR